MKTFRAVLFASLMAGAALAESAVLEGAVPEVAGPLPADQVVLADQLYLTRPVVVFADSPNDPNFIRQMELLAEGLPALAERDVIVVTDTDPAARSDWRQDLRPRGFSLVIMDKDLKPVIRKPSPWSVREITAAIDKLPSRRQELSEGGSAGQ